MSVKEGRLRKAKTQEVNAGKMFKLYKLEWSRWPRLSHTSCFNLTIFTQDNKTTLSKMLYFMNGEKGVIWQLYSTKMQNE
jgi:hypothetical protein